MSIKLFLRNSDEVTPCWGVYYRWGMKILRFSTNKSLYLANDTRSHYSYYGRRIGNSTQAFEWCRFQWLWMTFNPVWQRWHMTMVMMMIYSKTLSTDNPKVSYILTLHGNNTMWKTKIFDKRLALSRQYYVTWPRLLCNANGNYTVSDRYD